MDFLDDFLSVLPILTMYTCSKKKTIKPDVFDPVRIRVGTPPFSPISIYITTRARNTPPPWDTGAGARGRVAGLAGGLAGLAGLGCWLGWLG